MTTKTCTKCGETKPLTRFEKTGSGNPRGSCMDCRNAEYARRRAAEPERFKAYYAEQYLKSRDRQSSGKRIRKHGTDGLQLLAAQGGACAICRTPLDEFKPKQRHLDHCHASGKVRGWLCTRCNTALGLFKDSPERLRAASAYLERA